MALRFAVNELANLIAPVRCSGCGVQDVVLCSPCRTVLQSTSYSRVETFTLGERGIPLFIVGEYEGVRRACLIDFKNGARRHLARLLLSGAGSWLAETLLCESHFNHSELIPVPSSLRGKWIRGYDPPVLLAKHLAKECRDIRVTRGLRGRFAHTGGVSKVLRNPRTSLRSRPERLTRSPDNYRVRRLPPSSRVVVIDDVMVTGATLSAAMGALIRDGHHVVAAVVAARVTRSR